MWMSTPWVHSRYPDLAMLGDGSGHRSPPKLKICQIPHIVPFFLTAVYDEQAEIW